MASSLVHKLTEEQYLALEEAAEIKSEYFDGGMFAMSGGTAEHAFLQADILFELMSRLRGGGCQAVASELKIHVNRTGLYTYPDVAVICGKAHYTDSKKTTLLNPKVLVEVLSSSTEKYDRGGKFQHYREIESLSDYILVSQEAMRIERYTRSDKGIWELHDYSGREAELEIESIGVSIPLGDIYRRVEFNEQLPLRDPTPEPE